MTDFIFFFLFDDLLRSLADLGPYLLDKEGPLDIQLLESITEYPLLNEAMDSCFSVLKWLFWDFASNIRFFFIFFENFFFKCFLDFKGGTYKTIFKEEVIGEVISQGVSFERIVLTWERDIGYDFVSNLFIGSNTSTNKSRLTF